MGSAQPMKVLDGGHRMPACRASRGPGETTSRSGLQPGDASSVMISSLREHLHLRAQFAKVLDDVVGKAVVVVDHQET